MVDIGMRHHAPAHRTSVVVTIVAVTVVVVGCASTNRASTTPTTTTTTTARSATTTTLPRPGAATKTVSDRDNGTTVNVHAGERLRVVLDSTYWYIDPSAHPEVLRSDGTPRVEPRTGSCPPGVGCGTVTATFSAAAPGSANVTATRTICGEALRCTGRDGRYSITVVVT
jgi:hypothetical protein